jgi:hypothetical protein
MVRDLTNKRITERAVRNYAVLPAEFLQTKLYKNIKNMKRFFLIGKHEKVLARS